MLVTHPRHFRGFTFLEIVIVIIIAALIVGSAFPAYMYLIDSARNRRAIQDIRDMADDIDRFGRLNKRYPNDLAEIFTETPQDPWGITYRYLNIREAANPGSLPIRTDINEERLNSDYDLYSMGSDTVSLTSIAEPTSRDDIVRGDNGDFIGVVIDY
jgi:prepilin-type N-terminal cleavage/methylation domain-containing protein